MGRYLTTQEQRNRVLWGPTQAELESSTRISIVRHHESLRSRASNRNAGNREMDRRERTIHVGEPAINHDL
jgi:hypothetical protein